jgi:trk system potassium uptake protein TrkH
VLHPFSIQLIGRMLMFVGGTMLLPLIVSFTDGGATHPLAFLIPSLVGFGGGAWLARRDWDPDTKVGVREGFMAVTLAWLVMTAIGAAPFIISGVITNPLDAWFESMSGFTTTGASILTSIEDKPLDILFWRSFTHWIGGIGVIVLVIVLLPSMGSGGLSLYKGESGLTPEKLSPKIRDTGMILLMIYLGLTVLETAFLLLGGLSLYDSLVHTFGTVATGGFSNYNNSVSHFDSVYVETVILIFMLLGGLNFALYYRLIRGKIGSFFKSTEMKTFIALFLVLTTIVTFYNYNPAPELVEWSNLPADVQTDTPRPDVRGYATLGESLRNTAFMMGSIITTTGYVSSDYDNHWHPVGGIVILCLMLLGGCMGSTAGGIKVARPIVMVKLVWAELKRLVNPRDVIVVRLDGKVIESDTIHQVFAFMILYFAIIVIGGLICCAAGMTFVDGASSALASMGSIGPAFGTVGPMGNFAHLGVIPKLVNIFCMLAGRLEIFTLMVIFVPRWWKKA